MIDKKSEYRLWLEPSDPQIIIRLPARILKDLVERSLENGASVEHELCKRLARSLETELQTRIEDDIYAAKALEVIESNIASTRPPLRIKIIRKKNQKQKKRD